MASRFFKFLTTSNRYKHLLGGVVIGVLANTPYCAVYAGVGVASALELKDKLWGGKPDVVDWVVTIAGVTLGYGLRMASIHILTGGHV